MRGLKRLSEPKILKDRKHIWTAKFLSSGKKRPDSNKYGHKSIRTQLDSISYHKCFYCETKLKGQRKEVDHHIEVSVNKGLAFAWDNLYLACDNCNRKISHDSIPSHAVLDPFRNRDSEIQNEVTFDDEIILPKNNSALGLRTIKKYRLDTELLDNRRLKQLKVFHKALLEIQGNQITESRDSLNEHELNLLQSFKRIDNSFSRMFGSILEGFDL